MLGYRGEESSSTLGDDRDGEIGSSTIEQDPRLFVKEEDEEVEMGEEEEERGGDEEAEAVFRGMVRAASSE